MTLTEYIAYLYTILPLCDGDESREWLRGVITQLERWVELAGRRAGRHYHE